MMSPRSSPGGLLLDRIVAMIARSDNSFIERSTDASNKHGYIYWATAATIARNN